MKLTTDMNNHLRFQATTIEAHSKPPLGDAVDAARQASHPPMVTFIIGPRHA
jgi:hypothetical protein